MQTTAPTEVSEAMHRFTIPPSIPTLLSAFGLRFARTGNPDELRPLRRWQRGFDFEQHVGSEQHKANDDGTSTNDDQEK